MLPDSFQYQLAELNAAIIRPLDSDFKAINIKSSRFQAPQFVMYSRQEKLEIRYYLQTAAEMGSFQGMPHVASSRLLIDISSNDDDALLTAHSFTDEAFLTFGADWAKLFTFKPKRSFSDTQYAQLVALYKEGRGLIYVCLLFNKPPESLDTRQLAIRFLDAID